MHVEFALQRLGDKLVDRAGNAVVHDVARGVGLEDPVARLLARNGVIAMTAAIRETLGKNRGGPTMEA